MKQVMTAGSQGQIITTLMKAVGQKGHTLP